MPGFDAELVDIVQSAIAATAEPGRFNDVAAGLARRTGAGMFALLHYDLKDRKMPIIYTSSEQRSAEEAELIRLHKEGDTEEDAAAYGLLARQPLYGLASEVSLTGVAVEEDLPPNRIRDLSLALTNSVSRNIARFNDVGPWLDIAALHMRCPSSEIPDRVREDLRFLLPVIAKAVETSRVVAGLTSSYRLLLDLFDRLDFGAAFTDQDGRVVLANTAFNTMASDRDGLTEVGGIAGATDRGSADRLRTVLSAALTPTTKPADLTTTLTRRSGKLPLVVRAAPIRDGNLRRNETLALLLVIDPEDETRVSADGLAAFGILSPSELNLLNDLVRGRPDEEIAERRSTTLETARGRIKEATAKLACRSRLDLLRLAMATHIAPRHPPSGG